MIVLGDFEIDVQSRDYALSAICDGVSEACGSELHPLLPRAYLAREQRARTSTTNDVVQLFAETLYASAATDDPPVSSQCEGGLPLEKVERDLMNYLRSQGLSLEELSKSAAQHFASPTFGPSGRPVTDFEIDQLIDDDNMQAYDALPPVD